MNETQVNSVNDSSSVSLYAQEVVPADHVCVQHAVAAACCVCGGTAFTRVLKLVETRFSIHQCAACGTGVLSPTPSSEELASFYVADYYGDSGHKFGSLTEQLVRLVGGRQTRFLARHLPADGRVLDVGCGRGVVASPLAAAGYAVTGVEISEDAVEGIDERVTVVIADSLMDAELPSAEFDLVVIWHVLEHVVEPAATVNTIHRVLKPGGKLVVAVPNYSSWQARLFKSAWFHLDPPRHLHHFTADGLRRLLEDSGLAVIQTHHFSLRQNPFGWLQSLLNSLMPGRRNRLYSRLLNEPSSTGSNSVVLRNAWFFTFVLGMAATLPLAMLAALCRSGGTIHYVAIRSPDDAESQQPSAIV